MKKRVIGNKNCYAKALCRRENYALKESNKAQHDGSTDLETDDEAMESCLRQCWKEISRGQIMKGLEYMTKALAIVCITSGYPEQILPDTVSLFSPNDPFSLNLLWGEVLPREKAFYKWKPSLFLSRTWTAYYTPLICQSHQSWKYTLFLWRTRESNQCCWP